MIYLPLGNKSNPSIALQLSKIYELSIYVRVGTSGVAGLADVAHVGLDKHLNVNKIDSSGEENQKSHNKNTENILLYEIRYYDIETRSISVCQQEKYGLQRIRDFNDCYVISIQQRTKKAPSKLRVQEQRKQESNDNPYYKENELIAITREQEVTRNSNTRRTVLICDDEKDILLMFAICLQASYDVLTSKSGEECIKLYLDAKHSG